MYQFGTAALERLAKPAWVPVLLLAGVALFSWPAALMATTFPDKADTAAGAASPVVMKNVERVRIRVWGNADASGEYSLDHNSSISFPALGRMAVGHLTPAELEKMLTKRLSALTRANVTVSVDVDQFRPFFIMGHVSEPGAIAWRPGLKVIQAVTLARGVARSSEAADVNAMQDRRVAHHQSQARLTFALAQLARYRAEREGVAEVVTNKRIATLISRVPEDNRATLEGLMDRQNAMLSEQREALKTQIVGLQREREAAERELEAAEFQEETLAKQLALTKDLLGDIEGLWKRKLVSKSRILEQRSTLLSAEVSYAESKSLTERARARLTAVDQQIVMLPQQRRLTLNERIDELAREVAQLELASMTREEDNDALQMSYNISRETEDGVQSIAANIFSEILPGDVLIVSDRPSPNERLQPSNFSNFSSGARLGTSEEGKMAPERIRDGYSDSPAGVSREGVMPTTASLANDAY